MITLKGSDVYSQLRKVTKGQYKSGPNKDQTYYTMSHGTRGFTIPEDVFQAWEKGEISEISLEESTYPRVVIDADGNEETVITPSYAFAGSISNTQQLKVATHTAKMSAVMDKVRAEYKLDAKTLEAAL